MICLTGKERTEKVRPEEVLKLCDDKKGEVQILDFETTKEKRDRRDKSTTRLGTIKETPESEGKP